MTLRTYFLGMIISAILCFVSWILIVFYVDPETSGLIGVVLFFLMLFFSLSGLFALLGFYLKRKFFKNKVEFGQIGTAFRQGILFSLIFTGMLMLQSLGMLFWWSAILFIIGISLLELYFMSKD
ncbi:MAG: hypothetical protein KAQ64_04975 [Candidatus Pacebacteria bacterium]|nr:hypothetical protein [Candidatus Paceibacterota bacterium]